MYAMKFDNFIKIIQSTNYLNDYKTKMTTHIYMKQSLIQP